MMSNGSTMRQTEVPGYSYSAKWTLSCCIAHRPVCRLSAAKIHMRSFNGSNTYMSNLLKLTVVATTLMLCTSLAAGPTHDQPPQVKPCPSGVAAGSRCLSGRDNAGAYYWLAVPTDWNGTLVVHAHGGPELGDAKVERARDRKSVV